MANLRFGIVTFKGQDVGVLNELPTGGTSFTYSDGAPEIACALSREIRTHNWPAGVHPFFAHLGPEGWLRARQEAIADASADDDLGLLLAFGADCIGAVGVNDPGQQGAGFLLNTEADAETRAIAEGHRTISGVQAKILCIKENDVYAPAKAEGPAPYIAKFPREDLTNLVANEFVTLELIKILLPRDTVNRAEIAVVSGLNRPGLLVERFDRIGDNWATKLRCEDFTQVLCLPPGLDRKNKYNQGYETLARAIQFSKAPVIDLARIFARLVAFVLLGNTDCHLKNWSLLEHPEGLRLAPIYDVLNTYIYGAQQYSTVFGLQFEGQRIQWDQYDRALLNKIGASLGINDKARASIFKAIEKRKIAFFDRLNKPLGLSEDATYIYRASITSKWEQIYGE